MVLGEQSWLRVTAAVAVPFMLPRAISLMIDFPHFTLFRASPDTIAAAVHRHAIAASHDSRAPPPAAAKPGATQTASHTRSAAMPPLPALARARF